MPPLEYISDSVRGTQRKENKDRVLVLSSENYLLAILFDGISSAPDATNGIDIAINFIQKNYTQFNAEKKYKLDALMYGAQLSITQSQLKSPYSTFSAVCIAHDKSWGVFSNLGDSRIYEVTSQYIKQLSEDDNLPHRKNVVTKYLGMLELTKDDFYTRYLDVGSKRILLCSDGFYSFIEESLSDFHSTLNFDRAGNIKNNLSNKIAGKNLDDSSYIFII